MIDDSPEELHIQSVKYHGHEVQIQRNEVSKGQKY